MGGWFPRGGLVGLWWLGGGVSHGVVQVVGWCFNAP